MSLAVTICLSALTTAQLLLFMKLRGKERTACSRDRDGRYHPKENRQRRFLYYCFRLWYEAGSGGSYIKPRSRLPCLLFAVICVIARSMWMKSTSCLYYGCPFGECRTMMRAVHQAKWLKSLIFFSMLWSWKTSSVLYLCTNVSTLAIPPFADFSLLNSSSSFFFFYLALNPFSIPSACWQTLSSGRPCFLPVFLGRLKGGKRWKVGLVLGAVSASVNTTSAL